LDRSALYGARRNITLQALPWSSVESTCVFLRILYLQQATSDRPIRAAQKIMSGFRQKQIACRQRDSGIDRLQTMSKTSATLGAYTSAGFVPLGLDSEFRALS
jgi:hypothetical protein